MQVTSAKLQASFRVETDEELMSLASSASGMTPEARDALLRELEARLAVPRPAHNIQKIRGWYSVSLPRGPIKFPNLCPRCLRQNPERNISFTSNIEKKLWLFTRNRESVVVQVPHCADCARALVTDRRIAMVMSAFLTAGVLVAAIFFDLPGPVFDFLVLLLLWPAVVLYSRRPTVKLGECTHREFEFRFKKAEYAAAFAEINGVTAQNSDTIKEELTDAIKKVQQAAAV